MIVKTLFEEEKILSQMAGNNFMAIKSLPPLVITEEQIVRYVSAWELVCELASRTSFWMQGLRIAAKALAPDRARPNAVPKAGAEVLQERALAEV
jgi:hypothetical protein